MASTTTASDPQMPSTSAMAIASEMPSTSDPQEQSAPLAVGVAMKTRITKTKRAGILFPVARIRNQMKAGNYAKIIQTGSAVYLAAVMEYVSAELLDISGIVARQNNRKRITPRHVNMAVRNDSELNELLKDVTITQGGVVPFIHAILLQKGKGAKYAAKKRKATSSFTQSEEFTTEKTQDGDQNAAKKRKPSSSYIQSEEFTPEETQAGDQNAAKKRKPSSSGTQSEEFEAMSQDADVDHQDEDMDSN